MSRLFQPVEYVSDSAIWWTNIPKSVFLNSRYACIGAHSVLPTCAMPASASSRRRFLNPWHPRALRSRGLRNTAILSCPLVIVLLISPDVLAPRSLTVLLRFLGWAAPVRGPFQGASISQVRGKTRFYICGNLSASKGGDSNYFFSSGQVRSGRSGKMFRPASRRIAQIAIIARGLDRSRHPHRRIFAGKEGFGLHLPGGLTDWPVHQEDGQNGRHDHHDAMADGVPDSIRQRRPLPLLGYSWKSRAASDILGVVREFSTNGSEP